MSQRLIFLIEKYRNLSVELKASAAYAVCSILQNCISIFTLPLFARLLTTTQMGQSTVYDSWMVVFTIFITFYMPYGTLIKALSKYEEKGEQYISNIQTIMLIHMAGLFLVYCIFKEKVNAFLGIPTYLVIIMLFQILTAAAVQCWFQKKRFQYRYKEVVIFTLVNSLAAPILMYFLVIHSEEKGYAKIMGGAIVGILFGGVIYIANMVKGKSFFSKEYWKYAYSFNVPLLIYYLSQIIFNQSDRLMIDMMCGKDKAGIYGIAYTLALVMTFVLNAINNSYTPWFFERIKKGDYRKNRRIADIIAIILAVLLTAVIWYAPEIIWIFAGEKYVEAQGVVAPVAMSLLLLFYVQLFVNIDFYFENKVHLIISSAAAAVANILLNAWLIPIFGYCAAGYTTFISYILFALTECFFNLPKIKSGGELEGIHDIKALFFILLAFVVVGFTGRALYSYLYMRILITIIICALICIFKNRLIAVFKGLISELKKPEE